MAAYTKYSVVPTEDPHDGKHPQNMTTVFDYTSVFSYGSAFDYNTQTSGHYKSAFDYGTGSTKIISGNQEKKKSRKLSVLHCISAVLTISSYIFIGITFPITLWFCLKKLQQWERIIIFRLGKMKGPFGPGVVCIIPWLDQYRRIDMRTKAFSVPPQQCITVDNGIIEMGCEVKYRITDVERVTLGVTSPDHGLRSYGKTVLLNILTKHTVKETERDRVVISSTMIKELNSRVSNWGIEIGEVELSNVHILQEAEPDNPLRPILNALGNPGALGNLGAAASHASDNAPPPMSILVDEYSNATSKSSLLDFGTLAKISGLSGFQGLSATQPDIKKGRMEPPGGATPTPKTKLGRYLQTIISGPGGSALNNGVYRLQVDGKEGGVYCIFVATGTRQVVEGDLPKLDPDVSVVISTADLTAILDGTLPPLQAYLSGRLTVQGNLQMLMGFESLRQSNATSESDDIFLV